MVLFHIMGGGKKDEIHTLFGEAHKKKDKELIKRVVMLARQHAHNDLGHNGMMKALEKETTNKGKGDIHFLIEIF